MSHRQITELGQAMNILSDRPAADLPLEVDRPFTWMDDMLENHLLSLGSMSL